MSSAAEVAAACNLTPRRVNQLAKEGTLPRLGRGEYDLPACTLAYIIFLQKAMGAKSSMDAGGKITNTNAQRSELLTLEIEGEKLALAQRRGEMLSVADHEAILTDLVIETKANMMAVGSRTAPRLVGLMDRAAIRGEINTAVQKALSKLATIAPAAVRGSRLNGHGPAKKPAPKKRARRRKRQAPVTP